MLAIIYDITVYGTEVKGKGMKKNVRVKHSKKQLINLFNKIQIEVAFFSKATQGQYLPSRK